MYLPCFRFGAGLPCRGIKAGRLGEGGGEARSWLKLNREEVEDCGPRSELLYEAALLRDMRGDLADSNISPCV